MIVIVKRERKITTTLKVIRISITARITIIIVTIRFV